MADLFFDPDTADIFNAAVVRDYLRTFAKVFEVNPPTGANLTATKNFVTEFAKAFTETRWRFVGGAVETGEDQYDTIFKNKTIGRVVDELAQAIDDIEWAKVVDFSNDDYKADLDTAMRAFFAEVELQRLTS